jgi:hypothetical protein
LGSETETLVSPFTGIPFDVPVDQGLTDRERQTVRDIFAEYGITGPEHTGNEGYGAYRNHQAEFRCFELDGPNQIVAIQVDLVVTHLSDDLLKMILKLAIAANLALTSFHGKFARIVNRYPNRKMVARWPDAKKLSSVAELRTWLDEVIEPSRVYAD